MEKHNANKDTRLDIIKLNTDIPTQDNVRQPLPSNKEFGKNSDGYDILPKK